jgi:beta-glucosidase/6-phospho-beta-glucosidase/beta-galactosidase
MNQCLTPNEFLTGFESTAMPTRGCDVLRASHHLERYAYDLQLVKRLGIQRMRYSIPGNYIYANGPHPDWSLIDGPMAMIRELGIGVIADLVHHTSAPTGVLGDDFFANPNLPAWLEDYALEVLDRYGDAVQAVTVFNEPYLTTQFCGELGIWYPFRMGSEHFVEMLLNVATAIVRTSNAIRKHHPKVQLVYVGTCETHAARDTQNADAVAWANFLNQRRFVADDLVAGKVVAGHPLYQYLLEHGGNAHTLAWLGEHGVRPDVRGLDYYRQSEWDWTGTRQGEWRERRHGFAAVAREYWEHLGDVPLMLSETNYFGTPEERIQWHREMVGEYCRLKEQGADLRGYCWYPMLSSVDFQHMLLHERGDVDPVGIYDLDEKRWERVPTAFTREIARQLGGEVVEPEVARLAA